MSINKLFVPDRKSLKEFLKQNGSKLFYSRYSKNVDVLIGSSKSIDYIDKFINKYKNGNDSVFFKMD
jgi:hypothetical protein